MEIVGARTENTGFNANIRHQWIPYWNGLLHLAANINKNNMIERNYDWEEINRRCKEYSDDYLDDPTFCEDCAFSEIPGYLKNKMTEARRSGFGIWSNCKTIAGDNDIIYVYCNQRQWFWRKLLIWIFAVIVFVILVWLVFVVRW